MDPYGVEKIEGIENIKIADENMEIIEKDEDKETLITESRSIWNEGNLRKKEY